LHILTIGTRGKKYSVFYSVSIETQQKSWGPRNFTDLEYV